MCSYNPWSCEIGRLREAAAAPWRSPPPDKQAPGRIPTNHASVAQPHRHRGNRHVRPAGGCCRVAQLAVEGQVCLALLLPQIPACQRATGRAVQHEAAVAAHCRPAQQPRPLAAVAGGGEHGAAHGAAATAAAAAGQWPQLGLAVGSQSRHVQRRRQREEHVRGHGVPALPVHKAASAGIPLGIATAAGLPVAHHHSRRRHTVVLKWGS